MGRTLTGCTALLLAFSVAIHSAEARDSKAISGRESDSVSAAREMHVVREQAVSASSAFGSGRRSTVSEPFGDQELARRNPLQVKLGAFTLQPTIGGVKGAQLSIGF